MLYRIDTTIFIKCFRLIWVSVILFSDVEAQVNTPSNIRQPAASAQNPQAAYTTGIPINYVRTWTPLKPYTSEVDVINSSRQVSEVNCSVQYVDGLGRPLQTVTWRSSPLQKDIVTPVVYDEFGREHFQYLPYSYTESAAGNNDNNGLFKSNPFTEQGLFYSTKYNTLQQQPALSGENIFYSQTDFEASPLNRVNKILAAGNSWAGSNRGSQQQYFINTAEDAVRIWTIGFSDDLDAPALIPVSNGVYLPGELSKNVVISEANQRTIEFKDKEGQVVLKKVEAGLVPGSTTVDWLCTYYVYDDLNRLRFVVSPQAAKKAELAGWSLAGLADGLCFRYEYDNRGLMTAKKMPDAGWIYMIYDKRDRLVYMQDANIRSRGWWLATLYDNLNRTIQTAMLTGYTGTRTELAAFAWDLPVYNAPSLVTTTGNYVTSPAADIYVNIWQTGINYQAGNSVTFQSGFESGSEAEFVAEIVPVTAAGFTSQQQVSGYSLPVDGVLVPLTYSYYDGYGWAPGKVYSGTNNSKLGVGGNVYGDALPATRSLLTNGLITGSRVRVIEDAADLTKGKWMEFVNFYDDKGRVIQVAGDNYTGGTDVVTSRYDFAGKVISSYQVHNNTGAGINNFRVYTETDYDHDGRVTEIRKTLNDDAGTLRVIAHNSYDALGKLLKKELGRKTGGSGFLETQKYAYNIRGWLKGINWVGYNESTGTRPESDRWFAMDLSYDWGYATNQFDGNIAGMRWQSAGDQKERSYGYGYDGASRLLYADFKQNDNGWNNNKGIDYSMRLGESNLSAAYDANGNIQKMRQSGMTAPGSSNLIDQLTYNYGNGKSNRLLSVTDEVNSSASALGDYHTPDGVTPGYSYDENGNVIKDLNKQIGTASGNGIMYNFLNLPYQVVVNNGALKKGTITYVYDAVGNRLEKRVHEEASAANANTGKHTVTTYIGGSFVYENGVLQYLGHEEGRVRLLRNVTDGSLSGYAFDYSLKDHLGNTRSVITDEAGASDSYRAGMEDAARKNEMALFENISETVFAKPTGFDTEGNNLNVSKLYGVAGDNKRIGPGIVLKVMKGDKFNARVHAWYQPGTEHGTATDPTVNIVTSIASAFAGGVPAGAVHGSSGSALTTGVSGAIGSFLQLYNPDPVTSGTPRAYLNWIMLDEQQLQMINEGGNSGAVIVPEITGAKLPMQAAGGDDIDVVKNGYLYVYVSNESKGAVYFDDLIVEHKPGALLEETHYYPFGLTMAGISSRAMGRLANSKKFNGIELNNDFDLNQYEAFFRTLDPQTGRWMQPDPKGEATFATSLYAAMENNPVLRTDPLGDIVIKTKDSDVSQADFRAMKRHIRELRRNSATFREMYRGFKNDKSKVYDYHATNSKSGSVTEPTKDGYQMSIGMQYVDENQQDLSSSRIANIAHETGHAWRKTHNLDKPDPGNLDLKPWMDIEKKMRGMDAHGRLQVDFIESKEGGASYIENVVIGELKRAGSGRYDALNLRAVYSNAQVLVDQPRTPDMPKSLRYIPSLKQAVPGVLNILKPPHDAQYFLNTQIDIYKENGVKR